jgi:hypothetical protein
MLHDNLFYFWADMTVLAGSSGGPLIANDKLVGIVIGQPTVPIKDMNGAEIGAPFALVTKSRFVRSLLDTQKQRDAARGPRRNAPQIKAPPN